MDRIGHEPRLWFSQASLFSVHSEFARADKLLSLCGCIERRTFVGRVPAKKEQGTRISAEPGCRDKVPLIRLSIAAGHFTGLAKTCGKT